MIKMELPKYIRDGGEPSRDDLTKKRRERWQPSQKNHVLGSRGPTGQNVISLDAEPVG